MTSSIAAQFSVALRTFEMIPESKFRVTFRSTRVDDIFRTTENGRQMYNHAGAYPENIFLTAIAGLNDWQQFVVMRLPASEAGPSLTTFGIFIYKVATHKPLTIDEVIETIPQHHEADPYKVSLERIAELTTAKAREVSFRYAT